MKFASLFALVANATDLLDFFEEVETTDQLISRLDRLKRGGAADGVLDCLYALKGSVTSVLDDTLEVPSDLGEPDEEDNLEEDITDEELETLTNEEKQIPPEAPPPEGEKT